MNIAIVDDEKVDLEAADFFLRCYIKKFWSEHEAEIHIENFHRAEDFLRVFSAQCYHLVILGANMEHVEKFIRAENNFDTKIIFLKLNDAGGKL